MPPPLQLSPSQILLLDFKIPSSNSQLAISKITRLSRRPEGRNRKKAIKSPPAGITSKICGLKSTLAPKFSAKVQLR